MNATEILQLSFKYINAIDKSYNLQYKAIKNFFNRKSNYLNKNQNYYLGDYNTLLSKYDTDLTKDFIYKNDYFTTREMYLISPAHYLFYTFNVFQYLYQVFGTQINFSSSQIEVFYSGNITFDSSKVKENANFNTPYNNFIQHRNSYVGHKVLSIDLQDFFKNIKIQHLVNKLTHHAKERNNYTTEVKSSIKNIEDFLSYNFSSLPQLHHSIASSVLSQIYLINFTNKMSQRLKNISKDLVATRFVDDMYIRIPKWTRTKKIHLLLDQINYDLWEEHLNLNSNKTKIYTKQQFEKNSQLGSLNESTPINPQKKFSQSTLIQNKVNDLLQNNGKKLKEFFKMLNYTESTSGSDIHRYKKVLKKYIEVDNGNVSKVFNELIFGNQFKKYLNINDMLEILKNNNYILFNPSQLTIFFIQINNELKKLTDNKIDYIERLDTLISNNIRMDSKLKNNIIIANYFLQNQKRVCSLDYLKHLNKSYSSFIEKYVL